jgi:hypothetical protein
MTYDLWRYWPPFFIFVLTVDLLSVMLGRRLSALMVSDSAPEENREAKANTSERDEFQQMKKLSLSNGAVNRNAFQDDPKGPVASEFISSTQALHAYHSELYDIFKFYCSFGEPMNVVLLKSAKVTKLFRDCGVFSKDIPSGKVDLEFAKTVQAEAVRAKKGSSGDFKLDKGRLSFDGFLQLLVRVAHLKYGGELGLTRTAGKLIENHILPHAARATSLPDASALLEEVVSNTFVAQQDFLQKVCFLAIRTVPQFFSGVCHIVGS